MNGLIFQNFLKKKILENPVILPKILPQNWYINGPLLVCVGVYFQIPRQHIPTKTKLEYPPPPRMLCKAKYRSAFHKIFTSDSKIYII